MAYYLASDSVSAPACNPKNRYRAFSSKNPGRDLSGALQGAGGIGGLLAVKTSTGAYLPCADANGNITEYVDTNGTIVAHREFDPYGNTLVQTGSKAEEFTLWFSSKYWDVETGLGYWGYRYYHPDEGRWLSRDPIEEEGGLNLYGTLDNNLVLYIDSDGRGEFKDYWLKKWNDLSTSGNNVLNNDVVFVFKWVFDRLPNRMSYTKTWLTNMLRNIALRMRQVNTDTGKRMLRCSQRQTRQTFKWVAFLGIQKTKGRVERTRRYSLRSTIQ
jgi:RHS repeat-associated protein